MCSLIILVKILVFLRFIIARYSRLQEFIMKAMMIVGLKGTYNQSDDTRYQGNFVIINLMNMTNSKHE